MRYGNIKADDQLIPSGGTQLHKRPYFIRAEWDNEAQVLVATSDDVPGFATEDSTLEGLIQKLKLLVPELLEANGLTVEKETPFEVFTRRFEITHGAAV